MHEFHIKVSKLCIDSKFGIESINSKSPLTNLFIVNLENFRSPIIFVQVNDNIKFWKIS